MRSQLDSLAGRDTSASDASGVLTLDQCAQAPADKLQNCGPARDFKGIDQWLNTPDGKPLTLEGLKGRVVLIDFWTYSCINCQRTFPYLTAWDKRYRDAGLTIVGVHAPEFSFEHVVSNVKDAAARYGIDYPIAIDNEFATWNAWDQRFWPAHYLIDQQGNVRAGALRRGRLRGNGGPHPAAAPHARRGARRRPTQGTTPRAAHKSLTSALSGSSTRTTRI